MLVEKSRPSEEAQMIRICVHLDQGSDRDHARFFSGKGTEYALVCVACREAPETIVANLRSVSAERFAEIEENGYWEWDRNAVLGRPEVLVRDSGLSFHHEEVAPAGNVLGTVVDLKPIPTSVSGECLVLLDDGDLLRFDPVRGSIHRLRNALDTVTALEPELAIHVAPRGDMVAIVEARGQRGVVIDLEAGRSTMVLERGDHHPEQTDFPIAFFETNGELRLVHATDWNRLDVSDPRTGRILTDRSPTSYRHGEERPEHDLDYFHGSLAVSPGGDWVADNGWHWHPLGIVVTWSLRHWVETNRWESEDGPSKRELCARNYFWGGPLCWIDNHTLAVWGYGNDDENLLPAAMIFDAESGRLVRWFAGPVGTFAFDGYLFSSSAGSGTSVWDVETVERLLHDASFSPTCYHPGAGRFITVKLDGGIRLTRIVDAEGAFGIDG
jgi:hypothetical protein